MKYPFWKLYCSFSELNIRKDTQYVDSMYLAYCVLKPLIISRAKPNWLYVHKPEYIKYPLARRFNRVVYSNVAFNKA